MIKSEKDVKSEIIKPLLKSMRAWFFMPVSTGRGVNGVPDFVCCVPHTITQEMVGMEVGLFVGIEAKAAGKNTSMLDKKSAVSRLQKIQLVEITDAKGVGVVVAGMDDVKFLRQKLDLVSVGHLRKECSRADL